MSGLVKTQLLCVHSSSPVYLLPAVWPKPGWPLSTRDRTHLQDGQGKVCCSLHDLFWCFYAFSTLWPIIWVSNGIEPINSSDRCGLGWAMHKSVLMKTNIVFLVFVAYCAVCLSFTVNYMLKMLEKIKIKIYGTSQTFGTLVSLTSVNVQLLLLSNIPANKIIFLLSFPVDLNGLIYSSASSLVIPVKLPVGANIS